MLRGLHLKRLNWLVVDLDRGHRNPETVASDIEMCEQRMEALLGEIRRTAGHSVLPAHEGADLPAEGAPPGAVGESPAEGQT